MPTNNDWSDCHALLEMALDTIEERCTGWLERWAELMTIAPVMRDYPPARWSSAVSPFAKEMHQALDGALRCDGDARLQRLTWICKALECKAKHQDHFLVMVEQLRVVTQQLAAAREKLEPDVSDPIVALRDGLAVFDVITVKTELRELLRPDQYQYQSTRTNDNLALQQFAAILAGVDFEIWELKAPVAVCGAVSMRHPERDSWFKDE
jgi:hypothetical protein